MSKFTPGPWMASAAGQSIRAANGDNIATVCEYGPQSETPNAQAANARLIAAAPDLLAALEWFISSRRVPPKYPSAGWLAAVAAIAKAKGE